MTAAAELTGRDVELAIRGLLAGTGQLRQDAQALPADADLYAAGLSSLATIDLMMGLEERFGIEFPDRLLNRRTFGSIAGIAAALAEIGVAPGGAEPGGAS